MDKTTVGNLCKPYVGQLKLDGDTLIDYFDIASVDNIEKQITGYSTYTFSEAPSRARKQIKKGNILVSTVRPNLNAVALFDKETENTPVVSTGFCVLECKADTSPQFLFRYLQSKSFVRAMVSQATGASYPAVSDKIVRDAQIPVYSYEEQIQIANVLDAAANIISKRKQQLQKLDELVKARFVEMFGDPMTDVSKWSASTIGEQFNVASGGTPATGEKAYWENGTIPWIGSNMCQDTMLSENDGKFITEEGYAHSSTKWFHKGTVLVALVGATIGKTALLRFDTTTNQNIAAIDVTPNAAFSSEFVFYHMQMLYSKFMEIGSGKFKMANQGFIRQLPLICPPMELQEQFAAFVEQTDKSKAAIQKALDETQALFDSLMQKYFD